ncbi:MAG: winged helix-turn-helix domain-containing protein, partial [Alphaproteobacteria bacterium]|nr:winged helix-turn-helix domain-containing protein [Alphaproteobacteria bacterium]
MLRNYEGFSSSFEDGTGSAVIYGFDQFTLDTESLDLKAGSRAVTLEPQVFLLLQYLVENRDRVVSKDEIVDAVWDGRAISDSALAYAVKAARQAVGDSGQAQAFIRTIPRRG